MDDITRQKLFDTIRSVMEIDISQMDGKTKFSSLSQWDSFNNLMLISRFQEDFGINFTATDVENIQTIADLLSFFDKKAGS